MRLKSMQVSLLILVLFLVDSHGSLVKFGRLDRWVKTGFQSLKLNLVSLSEAVPSTTQRGGRLRLRAKLGKSTRHSPRFIFFAEAVRISSRDRLRMTPCWCWILVPERDPVVLFYVDLNTTKKKCAHMDAIYLGKTSMQVSLLILVLFLVDSHGSLVKFGRLDRWVKTLKLNLCSWCLCRRLSHLPLSRAVPSTTQQGVSVGGCPIYHSAGWPSTSPSQTLKKYSPFSQIHILQGCYRRSRSVMVSVRTWRTAGDIRISSRESTAHDAVLVLDPSPRERPRCSLLCGPKHN
ncbi:unnamed protein product [Coregonus sp. 'balchen']|nr:unnamed protein product [Coregonus sp. 'balchen']